MKRRQLLKSLTLLPLASGITNLSLQAEPAPEEPPRVAVPLEENDTASEDSGDALIYVEMQNGEIIEMPLREARRLIFHDKIAALAGI